MEKVFHNNPFLGRCIHGVDGAKIVGDRSISKDCVHCIPAPPRLPKDHRTKLRAKRTCGRDVCPPTNDCRVCE